MPDQSASAALVSGQSSRQSAKYDRLFIVTYGRSGSTLLQGLLNAISGYRILGENFDAMGPVEHLYRSLPRFGVQLAPGRTEPRQATQPTEPFFGFEHFNAASFAAGLRLFVDHVLSQGADPSLLRCIGFKEVRYTPENVARKVDFLRALYPGCGIIYNIRDPQEVAESEFQREKDAAWFGAFNTLLRDRAAADPDACLVRYEDVIRASGSLISLYDFLGETFDKEQVEAVLAVKHSYHSKGTGQVHSDVPRFVRVNGRLEGFAVFVVDRFVVKDGVVAIGGLVLGQGGTADPRRFARVLDHHGTSVEFKARFGMASPVFGEKYKTEAAARGRFQISFRPASPDEHRVFFDDATWALAMRAGAASPDR